MPRATNTQLYRWSFTLNVTEKEPELPCHTKMIAALKRWGATKWVFQKEKGATTGRTHYQGSVKLSVKKRKSWLLNNSQVPIDGLTLSPTKNETGSFNYCTKADTRVSGPWADSPIYMGEDLDEMKCPLEWQQWVLDTVATKPDRRTVHWIWEEKGNVGKSMLSKWMKWKKLSKRVPFGHANQLKTNVCAKGPSRCYTLDMSRTRGSLEKMEDIYSVIEEIKNGDVEGVMNGKIHELLMAPPHVFCFANELPDKRCMSADRWKIHTIKDLKIVHC